MAKTLRLAVMIRSVLIKLDLSKTVQNQIVIMQNTMELLHETVKKDYKRCLTKYDKKWKHAPDKRKKFATVFIDPSKAFDALNHNLLLLAKQNVLGFSFSAIKFVQSYLSGRFQKVNTNNNWSWEDNYPWESSGNCSDLAEFSNRNLKQKEYMP